MTASRSFLASLLLPAVAVFAAPAARAEPASPDSRARDTAKPFVEFAQKVDQGEEDNERKRGKHKGKRDRDDGGAPQGGPPPGAQGGAPQNPKQSRDDARKQKQLERQQAREELLKKKQDAGAARQDAIQQRKLDAQQAKEKALQSKRDAEATRQKALEEQRQQARERYFGKKPDNADAARKDLEQKKLETQQARDKALQDKRDAEAARRNAIADQPRREQVRQPKKFDRAKVDQDFERARMEAQQKSGSDRSERFRADKANRFEALRKGRKTREVGSRDIIVEPDKRVIVRDDKRVFIRHDDGERFRRKGKEVRRERRKDGTWMVVTAGLAGAMIYSILDENDRVLRRSRRDRDGREYVFFDDRRSYRGDHYGPEHYSYIDLPPPVVRMPRDRYIVEYDRASPDDIYDALNAPPIESLGRGYTLDEVRQNYSILERMRRVDLNSINFEFASWDVSPDQYPKLERIARAMHRVLDRSPGELFLIEGHTDAVGSEIDNLSLSDRRAETVAIILTDEFGIPAENLTTQGYGEEYLKEMTDGPSWINRRVGVRRITPLLSRDGWDDAG